MPFDQIRLGRQPAGRKRRCRRIFRFSAGDCEEFSEHCRVIFLRRFLSLPYFLHRDGKRVAIARHIGARVSAYADQFSSHRSFICCLIVSAISHRGLFDFVNLSCHWLVRQSVRILADSSAESYTLSCKLKEQPRYKMLLRTHNCLSWRLAT